MLSLLLITALAFQTPSAPKAATKDTAVASNHSAAVSRLAFHDRMRDLWSDHITYTRSFIVSTAAGLPDTAEVAQRLLRNQDEIGEAIKPYYGEAAGSQLASLLRNHIQLAAKTLTAAKGTSTAMQPAMNMSESTTGKQGNPSATQPANARVTVDTVSQRLPSNQSGNTPVQYQQSGQAQVGQVDSVQLNQAIADLKANGDSIASLLATANPHGFSREMLKGAIGQHITLLLQEATAQLKRDWSGSIAAFDESQRQAAQMADMLSDGIMKQYPSRFSTKATTVSSR